MGDAAMKSTWEAGKASEVAFWKHLIETKGFQWPDDYRDRLDPEFELNAVVRKYLGPTQASARVLDVGAGPMTILGKRWPGHELEIVAVDALADEYNRILDGFGIEPPVRTERCDSERLLDRFAPGSFDVVYARNTLDHSYDPVEAFRQMVAVAKPGGHIITDHFANEAVHGDYDGLHQWNFCVEDGDVVIWNPRSRQRLSEELGGSATLVELSPPDQRVVFAVLRKTDQGG